MKKKNLLARFVDAVESLLSIDSAEIEVEVEETTEERSLPLDRIGEQLFQQLRERNESSDSYSWPLDVYFDEARGSLFAIVAENGRLFQVGLNVSGEDVSLGDFVQVKQEFTPVQQSRFSVRRQADGRHRWTMIAASAVLNRVGEIDSTELFDSFVSYAERTSIYPRLDFYHLGSAGEEWEFGTADFLARSDYLYIASGLFDEDNPLAQATIRATERDPGVWGASIEFRAVGEPELLTLDPEIRIPVYRNGVNTRISVVVEADAAGWFTTLEVKETPVMDKQLEARLKKLFGDDSAALEAFVGTVDGVNEEIRERGLIARSKKKDTKKRDAAPAAEDVEETEVDVDDQDAVVELDEETLEVITQAIFESPAFVAKLDEVFAQRTAGITEAIETATRSLKETAEQVTAVSKRLGKVERADEDKQREWTEDLPAKKKIAVTYRPRDMRRSSDEVDDEDRTMADEAKDILSRLPVKPY